MDAGGVLVVIGALAVIGAVVGGKVQLWPGTAFGQLGRETRIGLGVVGAVFFLVGLWLFVSPPGAETLDADPSPTLAGGTVLPTTVAPSPSPTPSLTPSSRPTASPVIDTAPPVTPRARPKVGDVDHAFVGKWSGLVSEPGPGPDEYSVVLDLVGGKLTQQVGTSAYPTLKCRCSLVLVQATSSLVVLEERVESGEGCVDTVLNLSLNTDGTLSYSFDGGDGSATLSKAG